MPLVHSHPLLGLNDPEFCVQLWWLCRVFLSLQLLQCCGPTYSGWLECNHFEYQKPITAQLLTRQRPQLLHLGLKNAQQYYHHTIKHQMLLAL